MFWMKKYASKKNEAVWEVAGRESMLNSVGWSDLTVRVTFGFNWVLETQYSQ